MNDKFTHESIYIFINVKNIKYLIVLCYIGGLYVLCKTHQQNEIRHSKCMVKFGFALFFISEDLS